MVLHGWGLSDKYRRTFFSVSAPVEAKARILVWFNAAGGLPAYLPATHCAILTRWDKLGCWLLLRPCLCPSFREAILTILNALQYTVLWLCSARRLRFLRQCNNLFSFAVLCGVDVQAK